MTDSPIRGVGAPELCREAPLGPDAPLITPNEQFYVRDNFAIPSHPGELVIEGSVQRPLVLPLEALAELPQQEIAATLECAGNGRAYLQPQVEGDQWGLGAVSTAMWKGARLSDLLVKAGVRPEAVEVVFDGADGFQRSLPVADALKPHVTLVTEMNGVPLPLDHGGPLRLVVPAWYGVASVKWLQRIEPSPQPFRGHFQVERYVIDGQPLREMEPRSLILSPGEGEHLPLRPQEVRGVAWTGRGLITSVQLSDDAGSTWSEAELGPSISPFAWRYWRVDWNPRAAGPVSLLARASDSGGRNQPLQPRRNALGYCNNAVVPRALTVTSRHRNPPRPVVERSNEGASARIGR